MGARAGGRAVQRTEYGRTPGCGLLRPACPQPARPDPARPTSVLVSQKALPCPAPPRPALPRRSQAAGSPPRPAGPPPHLHADHRLQPAVDQHERGAGQRAQQRQHLRAGRGRGAAGQGRIRRAGARLGSGGGVWTGFRACGHGDVERARARRQALCRYPRRCAPALPPCRFRSSRCCGATPPCCTPDSWCRSGRPRSRWASAAAATCGAGSRMGERWDGMGGWVGGDPCRPGRRRGTPERRRCRPRAHAAWTLRPAGPPRWPRLEGHGVGLAEGQERQVEQHVGRAPHEAPHLAAPALRRQPGLVVCTEGWRASGGVAGEGQQRRRRQQLAAAAASSARASSSSSSARQRRRRRPAHPPPGSGRWRCWSAAWTSRACAGAASAGRAGGRAGWRTSCSRAPARRRARACRGS